ncbi:hypothetical protein PQX77_013362 [Marasmius sp. AFHP31]|nr:hypothetical protein PQX77_013362 [Marasmius sp. AFHP31]
MSARIFGVDYDEDVPKSVNQPTIFSASTGNPVAVENKLWRNKRNKLVQETCLQDGFTRFQLNGDGDLALTWNWDMGKAWISQAWSAFDACKVSLEDDLRDFSVLYQPIFLFISPPPLDLHRGDTSERHPWSFHEDDGPPLSPEACVDLSLPIKLNFINWGFNSCSWSPDLYKLMHEYQVPRGFDPTTTAFARHLGYTNIFRPINESDRFEGVDEADRRQSLQFPIDLSEPVFTVDPDDPLSVSGQRPVQVLSPGGDTQAQDTTEAPADTADPNDPANNEQEADGGRDLHTKHRTAGNKSAPKGEGSPPKQRPSARNMPRGGPVILAQRQHCD